MSIYCIYKSAEMFFCLCPLFYSLSLITNLYLIYFLSSQPVAEVCEISWEEGYIHTLISYLNVTACRAKTA